MHSFYYISQYKKKPSTAVLVMGKSLMDAFTIAIDSIGHASLNRSVTISAPEDNYIYCAPHALLKNELFIFGGESDKYKVRKLDCP